MYASIALSKVRYLSVPALSFLFVYIAFRAPIRVAMRERGLYFGVDGVVSVGVRGRPICISSLNKKPHVAASSKPRTCKKKRHSLATERKDHHLKV